MDPTYILLITPFVLWPFIARAIWGKTISWNELPINIVIGMVVVAAVYFGGRFSGADDIEIWNGQLTGKTRVHDHYLDPYDCNCRTTSCGKDCSTTTCDTCYEDRYTVDWDLQSTIGSYDVDNLDSGSKSVYNKPDPALYTKAKKGQACSKEKGYTNWVKAVPESLFNTQTKNDEYRTLIPNYPTVYSLYKFNHVLNVGATATNKTISKLNNDLGEINKVLGNSKQVNIIMIVTGITDPMYRYSVENAWVGAKKNDVVIFVGTDKDTIVWADVMTFAQNKGNELFHITMRDGLNSMGTLSNPKLVPFVNSTIVKLFDRISMAEFERLKDEIEPPAWLYWVVFIVGGMFSFSFTIFSHYHNITNQGIVRDYDAPDMFPVLTRLIIKLKGYRR